MRFIPEYEERYSVTKDGEIYSHLSKRWLKKYVTPAGYYTVTLYKKNSTIRHPVFIHRTVAMCYLENIHNKPEVNHINFVTTDNRVENLEWVTGRENIQHTIKHGRHSEKGRFKIGNNRWKNERHPSSKYIIELNNGIIFTSGRSAAKYYNIPHQYVFDSIKRNGTAKGLKFKYCDNHEIVFKLGGALRKVTTTAYP